MPEAVTTPIRGRRLLVGLLVIFLCAVVPAIFIPTLMCKKPDPVLQDLGALPHFSLVDERGQVFTEQAFRGHATIVSFIFTRCDLTCPVTSMKMANIQEKTFDVGEHVKLVSFSVDPKYDTPERLAAYAKRYRADPTRWRFVTGDYDAMYKLVEGPFMISMMRNADRPTGVPDIAHQAHFILVDPQGHIRGTYDSDELPRIDAIMHDARFLARTMK